MENYNLYLEFANSEVRALESHINFQLFLSDSIDVTMESTTFKESMNKMKERVIKFFKMILGAIQRFFIKLFGAGKRLGHKKAIILISTYLHDTFLSIVNYNVSIIHTTSNVTVYDYNTEDISQLTDNIKEYGKSLKVTHESVSEKLKDKIHDMVSNNKDKNEYSLIDKYDLNYIEKFAKMCEQEMSKSQDHLLTQFRENPHMGEVVYQATLHHVINVISHAESTAMQLAQSAMWHSRVEDNETKLKNPIPVEIED
jgi:hypothetical protein